MHVGGKDENMMQVMLYIKIPCNEFFSENEDTMLTQVVKEFVF